MGVNIIGGVAARGHVHIDVPLTPALSAGTQRIRGRSWCRVQMAFPQPARTFPGRALPGLRVFLVHHRECH
jgi:hypothetical protein